MPDLNNVNLDNDSIVNHDQIDGEGKGINQNDNLDGNIEVTTLTDEEVSFFDDVLNQYGKDLGGDKIDDKGNMLDKDGNIIKTKEELVNIVNESPDTIIIDGNTYELNDKGEAIDKEGKVIKTADEVKALTAESNTDIKPLIKDVISHIGIEITDDSGKPVEYEDTIEGIAKYVGDVLDTRVEEEVIKRQNTLFEAYPDLRDVMSYVISNNGSIDGYQKSVRWNDVTIDAKNEDLLSNIIIYAEKTRGKSMEEAKELATMYKDAGKLKDKATTDLSYLKEVENNQMAIRSQKQKEEETKLVKYWEDVETIVNKGKLGNVSIPANIKIKTEDGKVITRTRNDFYNYMSNVVGNTGYSQAQIDSMNSPIETKILYDYIRFTGNNLEQLIKNEAETTKVNSLKQRYNELSRNAASRTKDVKSSKIDLNNVDV